MVATGYRVPVLVERGRRLCSDEGYFFDPDLPSPDERAWKVHLLPIYDELIMGYKDRSALNASNKTFLFRYDNMVVLEGQVIGTWRRTIAKNSINLEYDLCKPLKKVNNKLFVDAVQRFSEFMNLKVNKL